jgi:hypothetical protein
MVEKFKAGKWYDRISFGGVLFLLRKLMVQK